MEEIKSGRPIPIHEILAYLVKLKPSHNIGTTIEDAWKEKVRFLDQVSVQNNVVVFLYNAFTNRFIYMSDKLSILSGLEPALFTAENGVAFSMSRMHPDQIDALLKLQQFSLNSFTEAGHSDYQSAILCLNYLFKNGNDEFVQVLQRSVILEVDEKSRPSLMMNFIHYVGHIKKHNSLSCVVTRQGEVELYDYNFEMNIIDAVKTFSEQEKKIVALLGLGLNTKRIAQKLFISPHTVDTHRRNLIKKAGCNDTTGVVAFAKLINLI